MNLERLIPRVRTRASEAASETAFALLDALWLAPVGIAFFDTEGRYLQVNEALARINGLSPEAHLGRRFRDLFPGAGAFADRLEERLGEVVATGRPLLNYAVSAPEVVARGGGAREWLVSLYPVLTASGTVRGVCAFLNDATEDRERAAAMERAREVAERSARRVTLLQEITAALSAAHDVAAVAEVMASHLRPLLGAAAASVRTLEAGGLVRAAPPAPPSGAGGAPGDAPIPVDADTPAGAAVRREEAVWLESPETFAARFPASAGPLGAAGIGALVALPLVARGRVIGALTLAFAEPRAFDLEERAFVLSVAESCAQALDRAQLFGSERAHRDAALRVSDRLARLQAVTASLAAARTVEEVARVVIDHALRGLGASGAVVFAVDLGAATLRRVAAGGGAGAAFARHARIDVDAPLPIPHAFRTGEDLWLESEADALAGWPALAEIPGWQNGGRAFAVVPLRAADAALGVVAVAFPCERRVSDSGRELLRTVATQCAQALERAILFEAEQGLRAEAERTAALLDAILGNAPIGIGVLDRELRFVQVNPLLAEMNGIEAGAHLGRTRRELLPGIPVDELEARWRQILRTGQPMLDVPVSGETPAAPGKIRHWIESWYPVRAGATVVGIGVLVREVTAEREAEEFQRHVLGIVGHDLRNPLSAVVTATKLLLADGRVGEREERLLGRALAGAERMDRIIRVLLDYARVRSGHGLPLHRRAADAGAICAAVCDELAALHPGRALVRGGEGDASGDWDPDRIAQALANLVSNALSYSPPESPVEVRWRGGDGEVLVEVANGGEPIPPEALPHLFEPFRRGAREREGARRDGLGLGLFIARAIVAAHGGRISARSSEASGTVFAIHLPRRAAGVP